MSVLAQKFRVAVYEDFLTAFAELPRPQHPIGLRAQPFDRGLRAQVELAGVEEHRLRAQRVEGNPWVISGTLPGKP